MNYWVVVYRFTWLLIAVACIVGMICVFVPKYAKVRENQFRKAELLEQKRLQEAKLRRLQTQEALLATDRDFVERTARAEGMVKSNETVCRFVGGFPADSDAGPQD